MALPASAATSTAQAAKTPATVYVSPGGSSEAADVSCGTAGFASVNAGLAAVAQGGTVVVCAGTYHEDVTVAKQVTLTGQGNPVINASGVDNGFAISADHVTVRGFTVTSATGEGILVTGDNATIAGNTVTHNDLGAAPVNPVPNSYPECQAAGGVPGDCGEGIHLMGSAHSVVAGNTSKGNSGGILVSDETGPATGDEIDGNVVTANLADCGVTVVSHNPAAAPGGVPAPQAAGVYGNQIAGNQIIGNGVDGQGGGVILATAVPGGAVYDNTVTGNAISGNGLAGVTVHSHIPGQDLNGNVVTDNAIGTNNLDGDSDFAPHIDAQTTGVVIATISPLAITVTGNSITSNHFGIWTAGPVTVTGATGNAFGNVTTPIAQG